MIFIILRLQKIEIMSLKGMLNVARQINKNFIIL